jgi:DNA-binding transcriptional regulator YiaG
MSMDNQEFQTLRQKLKKTQKQLSELLGISLKAVQSFEQGWRNIPVHAERQVLFLLASQKVPQKKGKACW